MKIAIHQPNYIPYPGFFDKMNKVDIFILFDDVQFTKGGYQNRVQFRNNNGNKFWLTVPLKSPSFKMTNEVEISYQSNWQKKHILSLIESHQKSPLKQKIIVDIEKEISHNHTNLADLNTSIIKIIIKHLNIECELRHSSELPDIENSPTERIISLCKYFGGTEYLSGTSGRKYLNTELFSKENLKLTYQDQTEFSLNHLLKIENKDFDCSILEYI